jgi:hypothetical protein
VKYTGFDNNAFGKCVHDFVTRSEGTVFRFRNDLCTSFRILVVLADSWVSRYEYDAPGVVDLCPSILLVQGHPNMMAVSSFEVMTTLAPFRQCMWR